MTGYVFDNYQLDESGYTLTGPSGPVHVEPQVFDVLRHLVANRDRVVSKEELLDVVWGSRFVSESALTSRVKAARRAIGDDGKAQRLVRTVYGRGYQFVAGVDALVGVRRLSSPARSREHVRRRPRCPGRPRFSRPARTALR